MHFLNNRIVQAQYEDSFLFPLIFLLFWSSGVAISSYEVNFFPFLFSLFCSVCSLCRLIKVIQVLADRICRQEIFLFTFFRTTKIIMCRYIYIYTFFPFSMNYFYLYILPFAPSLRISVSCPGRQNSGGGRTGKCTYP